ncbi:MOSC domain-containing protein [Coralloluteibacterium stylophorae]|uniref:MOSC domain-containing protein n=1 Tax=Coralloluteibacterium stylophorae TaxID=1776034 RepID=A0A8J7VRQ3_9GAMM|nr:MOSC N-terminal beta barrel domain-containing protein [Coralloluteibacterium stylophorae]MBS7457973.1 MOSC domain-containing protein [Coralloluteibacterium stylophorae]
MHLAGIRIHPIKSCAGLDLDAVAIEPRGPEHDRRYMLVDAAGRFVTGRQHGALVGLRPELREGGLRVHAGGDAQLPPLEIGTPAAGARRIAVTVWKDSVQAAHVGADADAWFTQALGVPVRLVCMDAAAHRPVAAGHADSGAEVSFADGFPLLLVSQAAVDALSARVGRAMSMRRFRPNLVIGACPPHAEDGWRRLRIGALEFEAPGPCTRCVFTTVDPDSGLRAADGEPLATLKTYRRGERGITFGINLIARGQGRLRIGDPVEVLG